MDSAEDLAISRGAKSAALVTHSFQAPGFYLKRGYEVSPKNGAYLYGETLLLLLNGGWRSRVFALPRLERPGTWEEMLNTARAGSRFVRKPTVNLTAHSVTLLRYTEPS